MLRRGMCAPDSRCISIWGITCMGRRLGARIKRFIIITIRLRIINRGMMGVYIGWCGNEGVVATDLFVAFETCILTAVSLRYYE